jgi:TPR repeat protein
MDAIQTACKQNRIPFMLEPAAFSTPAMYLAKRDYDFRFYNDALRRFEQEAQKGNPTAMAWTALIYFGERDSDEDHKKAVLWADRSVKSGSGAGMFILGQMHTMGFGGLDKSEAKALYWIRESANRNFPEAVFHLGHIYQNGLLGQPSDRAKAIAYYRCACLLGYKSASDRLAKLNEAPCD